MRLLAALWAVAALSALLIVAILRLGAKTMFALDMPLEWWHWILLVASVAFMAYSEGYKGFQLSFSPRFANRVRTIRESGNLLQCLLAPLYAMGFFGAPRRRMIATYLLTIMIIGFIYALQYVSQPIRGLLDAGVVAGLLWGLFATWYWLWRAAQSDAELTASSQSPVSR